MSNQRIEVRQLDDENCEIVLLRNGEEFEIATTNHDEHGWAGMEAVEDAVRRTAAAIGIEVKVV